MEIERPAESALEEIDALVEALEGDALDERARAYVLALLDELRLEAGWLTSLAHLC